MDKQNFTSLKMQSCQIRFRVAESKKQKALCQQIDKFAIYELRFRFAKSKNALSANLQIRFEINELDCC